jgi:hypothetical protein
MKRTNLFLAILVIVTTMSFKGKPSEKKVKTGVYGVCNCGTESSAKIELTINDDLTFHYFDNYNPAKVIDIKGNWILDGNTILLKDYKSDFSIHNKWQIDNNEKCLRSRKGLEFTRLCHIKSCN